MKKNATPAFIAITSSLKVAFVVLIVLLVSKLAFPESFQWFITFLIPCIILLVSYLIYYYSLEKFIYRKIKLIYKSIYDTKIPAQEKETKLNMSSDLISDAEAKVLHWQKSKLKDIKKQKKLEKYRKEFLGNVFHELKTPIFNIQGYLETLIEGGIHDEKINEKFLQKARKNVRRITEIVDDLQMISNLEDGSFSLMPEKFDIQKLSLEVLDSMDLRANKNDISLEIKEGCDKPFYVIGDKELIHQVLNNFVTNAIKYGKIGGKTQIGIYDMDEYILIEVSDDGIGIEQKHLPRIFERFYRVDKDRSRELGGSGLGLSIVKHIIEAHNQTVNIRSTVGLGTTFGFTLKKA